MVKKPFPRGTRSTKTLNVIYSDICGPLNVQTQTEEKYFITFIDEYNKYGYMYLIKYKHEALKTFQTYAAKFYNQLGKKIKRIRSNTKGVCTSKLFKEYCGREGIIHDNMSMQFRIPHNKMAWPKGGAEP